MEIREAVCHGRRPGPSTAISAACACVESVLGYVTAGWDCKRVWREGRVGVEGSVGGGGWTVTNVPCKCPIINTARNSARKLIAIKAQSAAPLVFVIIRFPGATCATVSVLPLSVTACI